MYWYLFLLGVFTRWAQDDRLARVGLLGLVSGAVTAACLWGDPRAAAGAATAAVIHFAWSVGRLHSWLGWRWLQFLGAVSYSLYLTHDVFGVRILNLAVRLPSRGVGVQLAVVLLATGSSLVAAYLMYRFVEQPFVRLSRRLKPPSPAHRTPS